MGFHNIELWDVSKGDERSNFSVGDVRNLTSAPVQSWNMSSATSINQMFSGCSSLADIPVTAWDVSNVTNFRRIYYWLYCL